MPSLSLPVLLAAATLAACGGSAEAPPASELERGSINTEPSTGPCYIETTPHSPQRVMAALVVAGYEVTAECVDDETTIFAIPTGDRESGGVVCSVMPGPEASDELDYGVVEGNVACIADTGAERDALRALLDGL